MSILQDTLKLYELILAHINEAVFVVDQEMRIVFFNRAAEQLTGFSRAEAVGQYCYEIFRSPECPASCALREALSTGKPVLQQEMMILDRDNREVPVCISTSPLFDEKGTMVGGVETVRDQSAVVSLQEELKRRHTLYDIITQNNKMQETIALLPDMALSRLPVLIEGESGTGKELFAQAIHNLSPRKSGNLVKVNCAAIPENLLESELFGYKKGAFTGADTDKPGKIALAHRGTLFLDEIGEFPIHLQAKLLRVLEDKTLEPLGSTKSEEVDFLLLVATNKHLPDLVKEGTFREDLYYRLSVIRITLLPLRERREDLPLLIDHFLTHLNSYLNKNIQGFSPDAHRALMNYDYPGNVRQLKHILEHASVLCRGKTIRTDHLPPEVTASGKKGASSHINLEQLEMQTIRTVLKQCDGNLTRAAQQLGIHRTTLWRKMKKFGLK